MKEDLGAMHAAMITQSRLTLGGGGQGGHYSSFHPENAVSPSHVLSGHGSSASKNIRFSVQHLKKNKKGP